MIKLIMWGVLLASSLLLIIQLFHNRHAGRRFSAICLHIVLAAFILYIIDLLSSYTDFTLPINFVTVATVALLGIPGVLLLISLKLVLL